MSSKPSSINFIDLDGVSNSSKPSSFATQLNPSGSSNRLSRSWKYSAVPRLSDGQPKSKEVSPLGSAISLSLSVLPSLGIETPISKWQNSNYSMKKHKETKDGYYSSLVGSSSSSTARLHNKDVLKRYENFKKFDTVLDHSDHHFSSKYCSPQASVIFLDMLILQKCGLKVYKMSGGFLRKICLKGGYIDLLDHLDLTVSMGSSLLFI
ncbi:hypothetical protein OSB04_007622 [Centaurea solstitialis]|uniref:Uncharacterized protein n=1 Tax=Centaurea solstitialis TaxID=347529 RepID=A0AA38WIN3_9ASTR|nr:hypothetical protein OSB04_007622 [Centaurea solstitialis]